MHVSSISSCCRMKSKSLEAAKQPHSPVQTRQHMHSLQRQRLQCSQAPSRFWAQLDWHHRSLGKALFTKGALNEKKSLLWTLVRVNAELIAALRQPCPLKISLTLPAGVVLPKEETFEYIERPVRSIHLSGLASKSGCQLLAASCLYQPAQMSGALSTSSLEVLNGQCVYHQSCDINH